EATRLLYGINEGSPMARGLNLEDAGIHVLIIGTSQFREVMEQIHAELRAFAEHHPDLKVFTMAPENRENVNRFLDRMTSATGTVFTDAARRAIYRYSAGWPYDIGLILRHLDIEAEWRGQITQRDVQKAARFIAARIFGPWLLGQYPREWSRGSAP